MKQESNNHPPQHQQYDVVIIGAGPAGLAAACRLAQQSKKNPISICVLEKSNTIGGHIISGALFETRALDELFPDWQQTDCPVTTAITDNTIHWLTNDKHTLPLPQPVVPETLNTHSCYIISLGLFCRWLAKQALQLNVDIFTGVSVDTIIYGTHPIYDKKNISLDEFVTYEKNGTEYVAGVKTKASGINKHRKFTEDYKESVSFHARYTILAEGSRGYLGKEVIRRFKLNQHSQSQHYALGIKEIWEIPKQQHQIGKVVHTLGWPLNESHSTGSGFMYHLNDNKIAVGLITDLDYRNPYMSPFHEFQRLKHHPLFAPVLQGGTRISYGAHAITKGGLASLPKQTFPGGVIVGCDAGTLNSNNIKGCHTAMKSGMLAAATIYTELTNNESYTEPLYQTLFESSWLYTELNQTRNTAANTHYLGQIPGYITNYIEQQYFNGKLPWTLPYSAPDRTALLTTTQSQPIYYKKPDGKLSFDIASSVDLANISYRNNQANHLQLHNSTLPIEQHFNYFNEPSLRYCPAGVFTITEQANNKIFKIDASKCLHCKVCDIKDPSINISWIPPEGGSGPNYSDM